jgi:hypothetical protein
MKKSIQSLSLISLVIMFFCTGCPPGRTPIGPDDTPTMTPTPWLIDDCEDGDNANAVVPALGGPGYWYSYSDVVANAGTSYVVPWTDDAWAAAGAPTPYPTFGMTAPGNTSGSANYCARITGVVTTAFTYGFVGVGVNLLAVNPAGGAKIPVDISGRTGIKFWHKGDGKQYRLKLPSQAAEFILGVNDNPYGRAFTTSGTWTLFEHPFTDFTQEAGWGTTVALLTSLAKTDALQFQTTGQPHASIDLAVDDIYIY